MLDGFFPAAKPPLRSPSEGPAAAIRRQAWFLGKRDRGVGWGETRLFPGLTPHQIRFSYIVEQVGTNGHPRLTPQADFGTLLSCAMMIR